MICKGRGALLLGVLVGMVVFTSCVSPFYGTARIEEGFHMDAGLAVTTYLRPSMDSYQYYPTLGIRGDVECRYGINSYFQIHSRAALGAGYAEIPFFGDAGVGFQTALPRPKLTPALRAELTSYGGWFTFSPSLLLGIGKPELIILGGRVHIFGNSYERGFEDFHKHLFRFPFDVFTTFRLSDRLRLFFGIESYLIVATLGLGYKLK